MKKVTFLILSISICCNMLAQTPSQSVAGEYYLSGVMETASGFRINPDSALSEFFFSQGALDRQGKGRYRTEGSRLISQN